MPPRKNAKASGSRAQKKGRRGDAPLATRDVRRWLEACPDKVLALIIQHSLLLHPWLTVCKRTHALASQLLYAELCTGGPGQPDLHRVLAGLEHKAKTKRAPYGRELKLGYLRNTHTLVHSFERKTDHISRRIATIRARGLPELFKTLRKANIEPLPTLELLQVEHGHHPDATLRTLFRDTIQSLCLITRPHTVCWCGTFTEPEIVRRLSSGEGGFMDLRFAGDHTAESVHHLVTSTRDIPMISQGARNVIHVDYGGRRVRISVAIGYITRVMQTVCPDALERIPELDKMMSAKDRRRRQKTTYEFAWSALVNDTPEEFERYTEWEQVEDMARDSGDWEGWRLGTMEEGREALPQENLRSVLESIILDRWGKQGTPPLKERFRCTVDPNHPDYRGGEEWYEDEDEDAGGAEYDEEYADEYEDDYEDEYDEDEAGSDGHSDALSSIEGHTECSEEALDIPAESHVGDGGEEPTRSVPPQQPTALGGGERLEPLKPTPAQTGWHLLPSEVIQAVIASSQRRSPWLRVCKLTHLFASELIYSGHMDTGDGGVDLVKLLEGVELANPSTSRPFGRELKMGYLRQVTTLSHRFCDPKTPGINDQMAINIPRALSTLREQKIEPFPNLSLLTFAGIYYDFSNELIITRRDAAIALCVITRPREVVWDGSVGVADINCEMRFGETLGGERVALRGLVFAGGHIPEVVRHFLPPPDHVIPVITYGCRNEIYVTSNVSFSETVESAAAYVVRAVYLFYPDVSPIARSRMGCPPELQAVPDATEWVFLFENVVVSADAPPESKEMKMKTLQRVTEIATEGLQGAKGRISCTLWE
ncbi:hypothetical protein IAT38_003372 [Cryptococcus sp. DSM 104549]